MNARNYTAWEWSFAWADARSKRSDCAPTRDELALLAADAHGRQDPLESRRAQTSQVSHARAAGLGWVNLLSPSWQHRMLIATRARAPRNLPRWF